ncbi:MULTISPECIES: hypothetical protein [Streptomycetaceae]|uniref:hypothetical protein n=1 Tax=Streptomycetaceae TaxID=2062 RepID=UPI0009A2394C|nr:hypothetical protein [Streptomyces sp. CB02056]
MPETFVDLGFVTAPSGVVVLGMATWIDYWRELGDPLPVRAAAAAKTGGGHLRDEECEAVAVPAAADRPLAVRATTEPSAFDEEPTIATLEIALGLPWPEGAEGPVLLGDLPVDRSGMVVGDAVGLDAWTSLDDEPADGLADLSYWGRYEQEAHERFGGERMRSYDGDGGPYGWLDLPVAEAVALEAEISTWRGGLPGRGVATMVEKHVDYFTFRRAGLHHPLHVGAIEVGGCQVLGIDWCQGDHAVRHHGGRDWGQAFPVTLEADGAGGTVLRWTIPPYGEDEDEDEGDA